MTKKATRELVHMLGSIAGVGDAGDYLDIEVEPDSTVARALDSGYAELVEVDDDHPLTGPVYGETSEARQAAEADVIRREALLNGEPKTEAPVQGESMLPNSAPETGAEYPVADGEEPSGAKKTRGRSRDET